MKKKPKHLRHSTRYLVAKQLKAGLKGTPLERYAWAFEKAGHKWNVNPFFVAAITGKESGYGAAKCGNNVFGWGACNGTDFPSIEAGIRTVTKSLRVDYMNRWGKHTVQEIGETYCGPTCYTWAADVRYFMRDLGAKNDQRVIYPAKKKPVSAPHPRLARGNIFRSYTKLLIEKEWPGTFDAIDKEIITPESAWDPCSHWAGVHNDCGYTGNSACGLMQKNPCPDEYSGKLGRTWMDQARLLIPYIKTHFASRYGLEDGTPEKALSYKRTYGTY